MIRDAGLSVYRLLATPGREAALCIHSNARTTPAACARIVYARVSGSTLEPARLDADCSRMKARVGVEADAA